MAYCVDCPDIWHVKILHIAIYGHFPKINISYPGTPGGSYKYLLYGHFPKIDKNYPIALMEPINCYYMVIFSKLSPAA